MVKQDLVIVLLLEKNKTYKLTVSQSRETLFIILCVRADSSYLQKISHDTVELFVHGPLLPVMNTFLQYFLKILTQNQKSVTM